MLGWFTQTTLVAAGLAALAALLGRSRRLGPEARHALWLVVLIKFAMPPVVAWPWLLPDAWPAPTPVSRLEVTREARSVEPPAPTLPGPESPSIAESPTLPELPPGPSEGLDEPTNPLPLAESQISEISEFQPEHQKTGLISTEARPEAVAPRPEPWNLRSAIPGLLLALWLAGSIAVVAHRVAAVIRFRRSLRGACAAPDWLTEEARAIGDRLGVRPPPILVAPGVTTPLLWCLGRPRLILPASLIGRLDTDRWPGIIAHELAHLARRDHWVVRLELLVEAVWWWNPLFHLTRRRLREEAEQAADARVVRALPDRRFAYAEALVDVCEHLTRSAVPSPALGVGGAGASRSLEGRLLMILRDPIPRRPGRRAALAAGLLAALSLPTWTLGQQPDPPKPVAPAPDLPEASPKPAAPEPGPRPRLDPDLTIEKIRAGFAERLRSRGNLSFRYSVATRNRLPGGSEGVGAQVADVVLGPDQNSRLDVLSGVFHLEPTGPDGASRTMRHFVARDESSLATFQVRSEKGPIPFRWQSAGGRPMTVGDNLAAELLARTGAQAIDRDHSIDPLEPRPANVLDLAGASPLLFGPGDHTPVQAEVAGVETVDGREVVRVAWFAYRNDGNGGGGLRGLLWVAPSLGFAVVRSEASQDPSQAGMRHGRRTWRKSSSDFVEVGGLWLPRKVEARFVEANRDGTPATSQEIVATIEDYRSSPELPPETFHPRFKIEALDEQTGQFTTRPPEPAPGLVDRLKRALAESPFGPPRAAEVPTRDAVRRGTDVRAANRAAASRNRPADAPPAPAPTPRPNPIEAPAAAQPTPGANPAPRAVAPTPTAEPAKADLPPAEVPLGETRLKADPLVRDLEVQIKEARSQLDKLHRTVRTGDDPALRRAQDMLKALEARYDQRREVKSPAIREAISPGATPGNREDAELADSRRNRKVAEVQKAEALRDLARAVVARNAALQARNPNVVSKEEVSKAEAELKVAEAELAGKKAELDEAELLLNRARSIPAPASRPLAASPVPGGTLADLRDAVELMEVQLQGKRAELSGAEGKFHLATRRSDRIKTLVERNAVEARLADEASGAVEAAKSELDQKKSEVLEFEVRLKQARRRADAEEARLRREADRAKSRLEWAESMAKKGFVAASELQAARDRLDDLLFQLDPKYAPAKPASTAPGLRP